MATHQTHAHPHTPHHTIPFLSIYPHTTPHPSLEGVGVWVLRERKITMKSTGQKKAIKQTRQTVRVNGVRTVITTRDGKVTAKPALPKEWELQAAQVRALRAMPEYGKRFLLAGDQNSAKRGPRAQAEAIAAGMTPGEADMRIYLDGGRLRMFENKVGSGPLSPAQKDRHPKLAALGHTVEVVRAVTADDAAAKAVALVRGWLAENDNAALRKAA